MMLEIKELISKFSQWVRENAKNVISAIFLILAIVGITMAAIFYGFFAVVSKENMLKSLIEAESTVLGFFAFIITYTLSSLDNRMDRIEQKLLDTKEEDKVIALNNRLSVIREKKSIVIRRVVFISACLVSSLLISILALGIADIMLAFNLCFLAMGIFFSGILGVFLMLYDLAKEPK